MGSQLAQNGDVGLVADLAGLTVPLVTTTTPGATAYSGQYWVNVTNATTIETYQAGTGSGSGWQSIGTGASNTVPRYLALLTQDPIFNGAVNISDAGFIEANNTNCPGYTRQAVTFGAPTAAYPSASANTSVVNWVITGAMTAPVQWVALVTTNSSAAATAGWFLASWALLSPIQVTTAETLSIGVGQLVLQGN